MGILKCKSRSAHDTFNELERLLNKFDAWKNFKIIILDTTAEVSIKHNKLASQYHTLDRIIKHGLDFFNPTSSTKPIFNYKLQKTTAICLKRKFKNAALMRNQAIHLKSYLQLLTF